MEGMSFRVEGRKLEYMRLALEESRVTNLYEREAQIMIVRRGIQRERKSCDVDFYTLCINLIGRRNLIGWPKIAAQTRSVMCPA
jgi:hypothetical protein